MVPELRAASSDVNGFEVRDFNYHVRYANQRIRNAMLSRMKAELSGVQADIGHWIEIDLRQIVADPGPERARRRMKEESSGLGQPKLHAQAGAAKAGVAAEGSLGTVAVIVAHADVALARSLEEDHTIGPNARTAR
jgi:hypothetical protein